MFKVYLAGPISGLSFDEGQNWREEFSTKIDPRIECYSPLRGKDYLTAHGKLEGAYDEFPLSSARGITERDRFDCIGADLVICNVHGAKRVSIGTMIELGWADANRIPVVLIMEEGNVHEHPMVQQTTSWRVDNMADALKITEIVLLSNRKSVKLETDATERRTGEANRRKIYMKTMIYRSNGGGNRAKTLGRRKTDITSYSSLPEANYVSDVL